MAKGGYLVVLDAVEQILPKETPSLRQVFFRLKKVTIDYLPYYAGPKALLRDYTRR